MELSIENEEFGFDDNGLQNVSLLTSRKETVSSFRLSENAREDSQPRNCEAIPAGRDEHESTAIAFDQRDSYSKEPLENKRETITAGAFPTCRTVDVTTEKKSKQPVANELKDFKERAEKEDSIQFSVTKEEAENVDGRSSEDTEAKFRSGRPAKDGGFSKSDTDMKIFSSILATSCATISVQASISLIVGIILLMPSVGVECALTSVPVNALFAVGKAARINCSTDLKQQVYWARTLAGSDVQQWLYYGKNGFNGNNADGRFSIDKDETTGRYDVIIANVQPKDAGQYVCVDESGLGARASAELVVSDPIKCNSHIPSDGVMGYNVFGIKQDFIQVSCSLTYTGNQAATLEWSWPGSEVQSDQRAVSAETFSVTSTLKLSPTKEHNNVKFQCRANIEGAIQHPSDSGLKWESETVNVRYAEFVSKAVDACPGVEWNLICNPHCSYYLERKDADCQCLYRYYDKRTQLKYQVTSDAVRCDKDNNIHLIVVIAIVAAAAILVIAAVVVAIVVMWRRNVRKKQTKRLQRKDSPESGQGCINSSMEAMVESGQGCIDNSKKAMVKSGGDCIDNSKKTLLKPGQDCIDNSKKAMVKSGQDCIDNSKKAIMPKET